jgi:hypothetical protein
MGFLTPNVCHTPAIRLIASHLSLAKPAGSRLGEHTQGSSTGRQPMNGSFITIQQSANGTGNRPWWGDIIDLYRMGDGFHQAWADHGQDPSALHIEMHLECSAGNLAGLE